MNSLLRHGASLGALCAALSLPGCEIEPGQSYAQCEGASRRAPLGPGAGTYLPDGIAQNCGTSRQFTVDGKSVTIEYFAYGELNDCPSGCFSSFACVINDGESALLYRAAWTSAEERPRGLQALCPSLGADASDTSACEPSLPARAHAVTQLSSFKSLVAAGSSGVFRYCL